MIEYSRYSNILNKVMRYILHADVNGEAKLTLHDTIFSGYRVRAEELRGHGRFAAEAEL
jgi:hypothetical protein